MPEQATPAPLDTRRCMIGCPNFGAAQSNKETSPFPGDAVGNREMGLWWQHCNAYRIEEKPLQGVS